MATLITGGAGYVGSHTAVALHEAGRDVVILDDFSGSSRGAVDALRSLTHRSLPVIEGDAADPVVVGEAFTHRRVDSVIHFAAFKSAAESVHEPLRYYRNNLSSLGVVAEAAAEHGAARLVFSSSAAVYGSPRNLPVTETSETVPINPYGRTKLMGEQILADAAAATGLSVVLLRYFNPVGAHRSGLIGEHPAGPPGNLVPRVMQTALGKAGPVPVFGDDYDTPDGTAIRDYVHVMDLAEGHLSALQIESEQRAPMANLGPVSNLGAVSNSGPVSNLGAVSNFGTVFNLGTGVGHSVLEVLAAAEQAVGAPIPRTFAPRRPGDSPAIWADCHKAATVLGWSARHNLAEMLADHWNWCRTNPNGYDT